MIDGERSSQSADEKDIGQRKRPAQEQGDHGSSPDESGRSSTAENISTAAGSRRVTFEEPDLDRPATNHAPHASPHGHAPSSLPQIAIDTRSHSSISVNRHSGGQSSPLSPRSAHIHGLAPEVPNKPLRSQSPRIRDRGFSLRRSILARGIYTERRSGRGSAELVPLEKQSTKIKPGAGLAHHPSPNFEISSVPSASNQFKESVDGKEPICGVAAPATRSSLLPHYEDWANRKSAARRFFAPLKTIKENIRKTILRIHELPSSKNGRHILLDPLRKKPLFDERRGSEYIDNTIRSTRHSLYNFLPRQLFAQFSKLANFYFLCVSILQMIPGLSTTGQFTTLVPLLFFVGISIAKEGYDDLRRHRLDKSENKRQANVLHDSKPVDVVTVTNIDGSPTSMTAEGTKRWACTKWEDVRVGDVIKIGRNEAFPADVIILNAKGTEGAAFVETMALDGETNLKTKQPCPSLVKTCETAEEIAFCRADIVVEDPNLDLYSFEGKVTVDGEVLPLSNDEVVYRGSILRNTSEATGMVIYTGEECKIRMNATKNPRIKAPTLQFAVNRVVIIIVMFVIALAIFNTIAYQIWRDNTEDEAWYLTNAGVAFFPILASFIILFNTLIPLSLYVSLEIVKVCQMFFLNDIEMFDEVSNTPLEARTSTINEELGQVNYVFSDKTGTLTNNSMQFRKLSVAGTAWLHHATPRSELNDQERLPSSIRSPRKGKHSKETIHLTEPLNCEGSRSEDAAINGSPISQMRPDASRSYSSGRPSSTHQTMDTRMLIAYLRERPNTPFSLKVKDFLLSMALCHTCFPEAMGDGHITYQAASPDELALVEAAQELGYMVVERQSGIITIKIQGSEGSADPILAKYEVLDVIEFSSARKRMSVIVRMPDRRICVICKGADSTMMQLLRLSDLATTKALDIDRRVSRRQSIEAQEAIRRASEARSRKESLARASLSLGRPSIGALGRSSFSGRQSNPIRDGVDDRLNVREKDKETYRDSTSVYFTPRGSGQLTPLAEGPTQGFESRSASRRQTVSEVIDETVGADDSWVFEHCFQHVNDFATEGLRTLLYCHRYLDEDEYRGWKKLYQDAATSLDDRQQKIEEAGAVIERNFELSGATAIEDKLQDGVPEAIDKLRRAGIKLWMLTGDKRETAITIGHSCRLIKDFSTITILDHELRGVGQRMAAATIQINDGEVAHSVVVIDGQTLTEITAHEPLRKLFIALTILVDTVICCRASPSQKASLVHSIRRKVKNAVTLAIGDGANDIAMIQEAHVGIGITGKEGLQAARTSDYSIAQFRFLTRLLFVHGRWNYIRTCKYTLGTFWKEMLFYLTQALFQRYVGYTGTSLYEKWSLSMFNTLFTSLPVIFMGVFEQDLSANTLMAVPELYHSLGPRNTGFNIPLYLGWVFMASSNAVIVFFIMLGLYGQALFTLDNGLFAMGALTFSACIVIINVKIQFWELHNKSVTCVIAMFLSIGGWFLWNIVLSSIYHDNVIYNVKDGFLSRFGRNGLWWLTLILIVSACWAMEIAIKAMQITWFPSDADTFRELEKDEEICRQFAEAAGMSKPLQQANRRDSQGPQRSRSPSEHKLRDAEVEEILNRPRYMRSISGAESHEVETSAMQRRAPFEKEQSPPEKKVSFVGTDHETGHEHHDEDDNDVKQKPGRRETEISDMLKKGFGSIRRGPDHV